MAARKSAKSISAGVLHGVGFGLIDTLRVGIGGAGTAVARTGFVGAGAGDSSGGVRPGDSASVSATVGCFFLGKALFFILGGSKRSSVYLRPATHTRGEYVQSFRICDTKRILSMSYPY
jgi:hypothetical protein